MHTEHFVIAIYLSGYFEASGFSLCLFTQSFSHRGAHKLNKSRGLVGTTIGSVLIFTLLSSPVQAGPTPGNDRISGATTVTTSSTTAVSTADATRENSEYVGSDNSFRNSVWYRFTANANVSATIAMCNGSVESRLFVYEVASTTSTEPTSAPSKGSSASCTNGNSISIGTVSGKVYYIQAISKVDATFSLVISTAAAPSKTLLSKVTICHRTHATTNPYRMITVSVASIVDDNSALNGHAHHNTDRRRLETNGPAGVFRPTYTYPNNAKHWGDIIPPFRTAGGGVFEGLNWSWADVITDTNTNGIFSDTEFTAQVGSGGTAEGNAAVAYCTGSTGTTLSARDLFELERQAGEDQADVLADLDEQAADEDVTERNALGGSFRSPTSTSNLFPAPVRPTVTAARKVVRTESKTVVFDVNVNESVTGISTSDFTTSGSATGCSVTAVSATSGTSVEVTVVCTTTGTVKITVAKDGVSGLTDIGPASAVDSTETEIFEVSNASPSPSQSPSASASPSPTPSASASPSPSASASPSTESRRGGPLYKGNKAPKQSLSGVVWADLNQNGVQDTGEPLLSDITCTCQLKFLTSAATPSGFRSLAVGPRYATTTTVKTNAQGQYLIRNAKSGEWTTTCVTPTGMTVTFDSTGVSDGVSDATVPTGGTGFTWVGMVGSSTISAPITDPSGKPAEGEVVLTWEGPDGESGTKDDVNFVTTAVDGEVNLSGLPAGNYRVRSISGVSVTAALKVNSGATFEKTLFTKKSSSTKLADTGINESLGAIGLGTLGFLAAMVGTVGMVRQRKLKS